MIAQNPSSPIPLEDRLRELGTQAAIHLSSVLRVAAVYDLRNHIVQIQVGKLERTFNEILQCAPEALFSALDTDLHLNQVQVPNRASQYKFIRTVLDEFARRDIAGLRVEPGFDREDLNRFLDEFLRPGVTGLRLLEVCHAQGEARILPVLPASPAAFDEADELEVDDDDADLADDDAGRSARLPAAARSPAHAVRDTRALFQAALQEDLKFRHARRVAQTLVDAADSGAPVDTANLRHPEDDLCTHGVNVCSVAASMGLALQLDRRARADLAVAGLFHDLGKSCVAEEVRKPVDRFTDEDWAAVRHHSTEGAKLLARSTTLSVTTLRCVRVALEHHLVPGPLETVANPSKGTPERHHYLARGGFPDQMAGRPMSVLSQIVAVADTFVGFRRHRSERGLRITPHEALSLALAECQGKFEDALLWSLVKAVGVYPLGQLVELDDRSLAIVASPNPNDPWRPGVRIVRDPAGQTMSERESPLLRPLPAARSIRRALRVEDYPEDLREPAGRPRAPIREAA